MASQPTHPTAPTLNNNAADAFKADLNIISKPSAETTINEHGEEETKIVVPEVQPGVDVPVSKQSMDDTAFFMEARELAQAAGLAWMSDGFYKIPEKHKQYMYSPDQKAMLVDAWAPVIQKAGIKASPVMKILIAEGMCSGPIVGLAIQNRQYRMENEELKAKVAKMERQNQTQSQVQQSRSERKDNKNAWTIDQNGFFTYAPDGKSTNYLSIDKRNKKPKPGDYDQLVKWNGKDLVHEILNIPNDNGAA